MNLSQKNKTKQNQLPKWFNFSIRIFILGKLNDVKRLIQNGVDVNMKDEKGWFALYIASRSGHVPIVDLLIKNGADVNLKSNVGRSPLFITALKGKNCSNFKNSTENRQMFVIKIYLIL